MQHIIKEPFSIQANLRSENDRNRVRYKRTYEVRTIETASLRMDSPKTSMLRTGSTSKAEKMAKVATGSTAEIKDPKAKDSTKDRR